MLKNIVAKMLHMTKTVRGGLLSNDEALYLLKDKSGHRSSKQRILEKLRNYSMARIVEDIELILDNKDELGLTNSEIRAFLKKMYGSPQVISSYCDGLSEEEKLEISLRFLGHLDFTVGDVFPSALQQVYDEKNRAMKKSAPATMCSMWEWDRPFSLLSDEKKERIWNLFHGKIDPSATGKFAKYAYIDNKRCKRNRLIAGVVYQSMKNRKWVKFADIWNSLGKTAIAKRPLSSFLNILSKYRLIEKRVIGKKTRYSITRLGENALVRVQSHNEEYKRSDAPFFEEIKKKMLELLEKRTKPDG